MANNHKRKREESSSPKLEAGSSEQQMAAPSSLDLIIMGIDREKALLALDRISDDHLTAAIWLCEHGGKSIEELREITKPFRLLDLPGELRNSIYEKVLEDEVIGVRRSPRPAKKKSKKKPSWKDSVCITSPFMRLNKQVSSEFAHVAIQTADMQATVVDFDFGHVIAFLNQLPKMELSTLSKETTQRAFKIVFARASGGGTQQLRRWLNRMEVPQKKGTSIAFLYAREPRKGGVAKRGDRINHDLLRSMLQTYIVAGSESRAAVEANKIRKTFRTTTNAL